MRTYILNAVFAVAVLASGIQARSTNRTVQLDIQPPPSSGYLGIRLGEIDEDRAKVLKLRDNRGVEVREVEPNSPAERAGLKPADVLLTYNGENILGGEQFVRLVRETPPGRKVNIEIWRDGHPQALSVTTGSPPVRTNFARMPSPPWTISPMPDIPTALVVWRNLTLGVECEPLGPQLSHFFGVKGGVLMRSVEKDSPGDKAGLRAGDVLTGLGDRPIYSLRDFNSFMRNLHNPGAPIPVTVVRDHKEMRLTAIPAEPQQ